MKENGRISTCKRLDLQTLGSRGYAQKWPDHWPGQRNGRQWGCPMALAGQCGSWLVACGSPTPLLQPSHPACRAEKMPLEPSLETRAGVFRPLDRLGLWCGPGMTKARGHGWGGRQTLGQSPGSIWTGSVKILVISKAFPTPIGGRANRGPHQQRATFTTYFGIGNDLVQRSRRSLVCK